MGIASVFSIANFVLDKIKVFNIKSVRNTFWNLRAFDIDKKWGDTSGDYETIKQVIETTTANRILDFGCGSGRLFPLYQSLNIPEVVGQDISANAIALLKKKHSSTRYKTIAGNILKVNYPPQYFDLIISNKSLSAVPPEEIQKVIDKLCLLGKNIYVNELTEPTETAYWHRHDYDKIFSKSNFFVTEKGAEPNTEQTWFLYSHSPNKK